MTEDGEGEEGKEREEVGGLEDGERKGRERERGRRF